jgi:NitT/TauT family transport system permease protein
MNQTRPTAIARIFKFRAVHVFTILCLAAWALYASLVEAYLMPGPVLVAKRFVEFFSELNQIEHMFWSVFHVLAAIAIAFIVGSALAFLPFYYRVFRLAVYGRFTPFMNSFPGIGWLLLAVMWFGINHITVVFAIAVVLVPFTIINMREGLDNLDHELIEMGHSFGRGRWNIFSKILLPSLFPFIFATLRINFGVAWKVSLTAELFGGDKGLGSLLNLARQDFDTPLILVVIVIIIAFVYSTDRWIFTPVQNYLAKHHAS